MSDINQAQLKRYFSLGSIFVGLFALVAVGYFVFIALSSKLEGAILISGFAAIGMSVLWRNLQHYSGVPTVTESGDSHRKSLIGRSALGGPGRPRPLLYTLLLIQGIVIALSAATGIDREAIVIVSFFVAEDLIIFWISELMKRAGSSGTVD